MHLLLIAVLFSPIWAGVITNITSLQEVQDSGDSYPTLLPFNTSINPFRSKRVLFVLSHGVEDHEVYYIHQYFTSRGAQISFGCPGNFSEVVLSDFFKPTYKVQCDVSISSPDIGPQLSQFDGIYIPGGVPSSTAVRTEKAFTKALWNFVMNPANSQKLVAIICSGNEVLIDSGLLNEFAPIVGSPASWIPLEKGYEALFKPASNYKGMDPAYRAIPYPSNGQRSHVVLGKNPDASQDFVVAIGNTWVKANEVVPPSGSGVPLTLKNGKYISAQFFILNSMDEIPYIYDPIPIIKPLFTTSSKVAIAISSGAHGAEVVALNNYFTLAGAQVTFICPSWVPPYKQGKVFLHTSPPARVTHVADCQTGFNVLSNDEFDIIVVPSGLFSTGGVLRNDYELVTGLNRASGTVLFIGDAGLVLIPTRRGIGAEIQPIPEIERDLIDAGFKMLKGQEPGTFLEPNLIYINDWITWFSGQTNNF